MAVTSVILDIKANTDRALNDFKRFSAQLDNKFLISGLKLDVVRSALGQINREFQKAIGEQGLQAGRSLREAQNQAALLTQTFKSFSSTASMDMAEQFSSAFNAVVVKAGGTAKDVQKALAATPFISTNLPEDMRKALGEGIVSFQRDFRRAGLGDNFGGIARQFLMGQLTAGQMIESGDAMQTQIGLQLAKKTGVQDYMGNAQQRSQAFLDFVQDPKFNKQLSDMVRRASGFRSIIEDLNTQLFNPEKGVFGALRQVTMSVKDKTTIFDETTKLINSVFGRQGLFVNFFAQIRKIFGLDDPLKLIIIGIRFITKQFETLNKFVQSPEFQNIVKFVREVFTRTRDFFTSLYREISTKTFDKESIISQIREVGDGIRSYIRRIAEVIRGEDISDEAKFGSSIIGTLVEEIGKTLVTLIREIGGALIPKAGTIALTLTGELAKALGNVLKEVFSSPMTGLLGAGLLGYGGLRSVGAIRDLQESGGIPGVANRFFGRPFRPRRSGTRTVGGGGGRGGRGVSGGGGGAYGPPGLDDLLESVRNAPDRYSLDPMFQNIRETNDINRFNREFSESQRQFQERELFQSRMARSRFRMEGPLEIGRYGSQYSSAIGPLPHGSAEPWTMAGGAYQPYMGEVNKEAMMESRRREIARRQSIGSRNRLTSGMRNLIFTSGSHAVSGWDRSPENLAARYNRRYGFGGTRAVMGRGVGNFARGVSGYYRGGGGTGVTGLAGIGIATASMAIGQGVGGETGENISALGQIGGGALAGASTGAMLGSIIPIPVVGNLAGAVIGAVIGGAAPLMDKSVREAVGRFGAYIGQGFSDAGKGVVEIWSTTMENIRKDLLVTLPEKITEGIKSVTKIPNLIDMGKNFLGELWNKLQGKEVGGRVVKGVSYIVGERGPEIFSPGETGTISSNRELTSLNSRGYRGSNVSANFNIAINVNGNMGAGDVEMLRRPVLAIIEEAWSSATQGTVSRGAPV